MSKNETLYHERRFLGPDDLDAVRAYLEVTHWPNTEHPPHVTAGFGLTEEGQGHFCIYDARDESEDRLPRVREAAVKVIETLRGLVHAIDTYDKEHPFVPAAEKDAGE